MPILVPNTQTQNGVDSPDPRVEYLAGGYLNSDLAKIISMGGNGLTISSDELIKEFGIGIYDQMAKDPEIAKCVKLLKISTLGDGVVILPNLSDNHKEYAQSRFVSDFCSWALSDMRNPLKHALEQMLDAIKYGHKVAEVVFKTKTHPELNRPFLVVDRVKPKPVEYTRFVVDDSFNVLGIVGTTRTDFAYSSPVTIKSDSVVKTGNNTYITDVDGQKHIFVNIDKFLVLTLDSENDDPRGRSLLRPAFNFWHIKNQIIPEYLRYLLTCSIPLLVGFTPEQDTDSANTVVKNPDGTVKKDAAGNPVRINPVQALREALMQARNSTALALKGGSDVKEISANGSGIPFYKAIELFDSQIERAILLQTLATSESRFNTRAASETHMTVLDQLIFDLKQKVAEVITSLLKTLIKYNLGEQYLKYLPIVTLGDTERRNFVTDATAVASLYAAGYLSEDQKRACDAMLQLPIRDNQFENITPDEVMRYSSAILTQAQLEAELKKTREEANFEKIRQIAELQKLLETVTDAKVRNKINDFITKTLEGIEADKVDGDTDRITDTFINARRRASILTSPKELEQGNLDRVDYPKGIDSNVKLPLPSSGSRAGINTPYISVKAKPSTF